jgi:hypothetical protein
MTSEQREFVTDEELDQFEARLFPRRRRLTWAVDFAQEDIEQLSPGRLYDLQCELRTFLLFGGGSLPTSSGEYPLPTKEDLRATQTAWVQMITMLLEGREQETLGVYHVRVFFGGRHGRPSVMEVLQHASIPEQARYALGQLLRESEQDRIEAAHHFPGESTIGELLRPLEPEGPLIKACPAAKVRGSAQDTCGRWFVGRPNQRYCSPQCQNRAATRATRARASTKTPDRKRGTRKQSRQRKG